MQAKIHYLEIIRGVYWVEINDLDLRILCACPADIVKHMMLKGLIHTIQTHEIQYETGPNAILLSDLMLQNGQFSNMAEFPVLQMLYNQGMLLPNHPNNTDNKPLLIGSAAQIKAQMEYIYYGNYGLDSYELILECTGDEKLANELWQMKKKFAFGQIHHTEELLDSVILQHNQAVIYDQLHITRVRTNVFRFEYLDETLTIDLNLPPNTTYPAPYPLGFHDIKREYFSVIHSGQGDGFDVNRPSMSSIISFQGRIYIIDAGPNIAYSLITLGIGISEIEGVFQTHAHDDHFAGITSLLRSDHRIKFYATPLVCRSIFKKLAVLLSTQDEDFSHYFEIVPLKSDCWNDINGLEVKPVISPHPVETTVFFFKTFWGGNYYSYAHLADISSMQVLEDMIVENPKDDMGLSKETYEQIKSAYLTTVNLKKIDIGGGMIHGCADDFSDDKSPRIILAHTAQPLTAEQKAIGSSAPFGVVDLMIPEYTNNMHRHALAYLEAYFTGSSRSQIEKILNNEIITYPPGSLIIKKNEINPYIYLVLTGYVEKFDRENYNMVSAGSFIGEYSGLKQQKSTATFRSVSYVHALQIPASAYLEFVQKKQLYLLIEEQKDKYDFLQQHPLFREFIGATTLREIANHMIRKDYYHTNQALLNVDTKRLSLICSGIFEIHTRHYQTRLSHNDQFHYEPLIREENPIIQIHPVEAGTIYEIEYQVLQHIPIVLWKLLEIYHKQKIEYTGLAH